MVTVAEKGTFADRHPLKGERFWSRDSPNRTWDAVIVGSGMGGLTTAAMLAELGKRVLVLEQHYVPGGFTSCLQSQGVGVGRRSTRRR